MLRQKIWLEEVARFYTYNNIPDELVQVSRPLQGIIKK